MSGRVLLIDDDPSMVEMLHNRLTRRGFTVTTLTATPTRPCPC